MKEIICIDFSNSDDYSVASCFCKNCKSLIATRRVLPNKNWIDVPVFKECPNCGLKFAEYIVSK